MKKKKVIDKSGIRTHAPFETRKLLLVVELRYTLTWRLGPTRPSYQLVKMKDTIATHKLIPTSQIPHYPFDEKSGKSRPDFLGWGFPISAMISQICGMDNMNCTFQSV
jgi:hypothetical protein